MSACNQTEEKCVTSYICISFSALSLSQLSLQSSFGLICGVHLLFAFVCTTGILGAITGVFYTSACVCKGMGVGCFSADLRLAFVPNVRDQFRRRKKIEASIKMIWYGSPFFGGKWCHRTWVCVCDEHTYTLLKTDCISKSIRFAVKQTLDRFSIWILVPTIFWFYAVQWVKKLFYRKSEKQKIFLAPKLLNIQ